MKGFGQRLSSSMTKRMAKRIGKEAFLEQLKAEWARNLPGNRKSLDVEEVVNGAMQRIQKAGPFKDAFEIAGITKEDLRKVLEELVNE